MKIDAYTDREDSRKSFTTNRLNPAFIIETETCIQECLLYFLSLVL